MKRRIISKIKKLLKNITKCKRGNTFIQHPEFRGVYVELTDEEKIQHKKAPLGTMVITKKTGVLYVKHGVGDNEWSELKECTDMEKIKTHSHKVGLF
jgi:hypothetical protein